MDTLTSDFSPITLARKLEELRDQLSDVQGIDHVLVEMNNVDLTNPDQSVEAFDRFREQIRQRTSNPDAFDVDGRTALNVSAAAVAGAKMVIDSAKCTRSLSKRLAASASVVCEDDILYQGLPSKGGEFVAARQAYNSRKGELMESLVDFHKQIQFKMNVLKHIDVGEKKRKGMRDLSKSDTRITRGRAAQKVSKNKPANKKTGVVRVNAKLLRTPAHRTPINPLDDRRIYDEYAHNIASDLREDANKRRRRTIHAPIPFHLSDDEGDENDDVLMSSL